MTAVGEDVELRDLVLQELESNGTLGKLKAQLRASVFMALDNSNTLKANPETKDDTKINALKKSSEGLISLALCRELLAACNLTYSLCVFDSEIKHGIAETPLPSRPALLSSLALSDITENVNSSSPLLISVVSTHRIHVLAGKHGIESSQVEMAYQYFVKFQTDCCLSYENLMRVLEKAFPSIGKNVLQDYCTDRYSDGASRPDAFIDFEEFLGPYVYFLEMQKSSAEGTIKSGLVTAFDNNNSTTTVKSLHPTSTSSQRQHDNLWKQEQEGDLNLLPKIQPNPSRKNKPNLSDLGKTLDFLNIDDKEDVDESAKSSPESDEKKEPVADNPDEFFNEKPPWETEKEYDDDFIDEEPPFQRKAVSVSLSQDDCKVTDLSDEEEDVTVDESLALERKPSDIDIPLYSPTSSASDFTLNVDGNNAGRPQYSHLAGHPRLANVQFLEDVERVPEEPSGSTKF